MNPYDSPHTPGEPEDESTRPPPFNLGSFFVCLIVGGALAWLILQVWIATASLP